MAPVAPAQGAGRRALEVAGLAGHDRHFKPQVSSSSLRFFVKKLSMGICASSVLGAFGSFFDLSFLPFFSGLSDTSFSFSLPGLLCFFLFWSSSVAKAYAVKPLQKRQTKSCTPDARLAPAERPPQTPQRKLITHTHITKKMRSPCLNFHSRTHANGLRKRINLKNVFRVSGRGALNFEGLLYAGRILRHATLPPAQCAA